MVKSKLDPYEFIIAKAKSVDDCLASSANYLQVIQKLFSLSVDASEKKFGYIEKLIVDNLDPETIWEELQCRNRPHNRYLRKFTAFLKKRLDSKQSKKYVNKSNKTNSKEKESYNEYDDDEGEDSEYIENISGNVEEEGEEDHYIEEIAPKKVKTKFDDDDDDVIEDEDIYDVERDDYKEMDEDGEDYDNGNGADFNEDDDEDGENDDDDDDDEDDEINDDEDINEEYDNIVRDPDNIEYEVDDEYARDSGEDDSAGENEESLTPHLKRQRRLQEQISEIEKDMVAKKSWELSGEVKALDRPQNSLLSTFADVERASKPAPVITPEFTTSIEDLIKKRILSETFNNISRRSSEKPKEQPVAIELSAEKSSLGLGDIYAQEFEKKTMKVKEPEKENTELHKEILQLYDQVAQELDALSHFFFTPSPVVAEISLKSEAPISLEEFIPMSHATSVQPVQKTKIMANIKNSKKRKHHSKN